MSSKSDRDNRSNQLNPNNDAYYSSRGCSRNDDGDEDEIPYAKTASLQSPRPPWVERSETYGFGAVSMSGRAQYVTAKFNASGRQYSFEPAHKFKVMFEDYLEDFVHLARGHLKNLLDKEDLALYVVFDPSADRLPWHAALFPDDLESTRAEINLRKCVYVGSALRPGIPMSKDDQVLRQALMGRISPAAASRKPPETKLNPKPFIESLRRAIRSDAMCIGDFQVPHEGRISAQEHTSILWKLAALRR